MKYSLVSTLIFLIGHWGIQEFDIKRRDLLLHVCIRRTGACRAVKLN